MIIFSNSETAPLKAVLMGYMENFKIGSPVNAVQRHYYRYDPPKTALMTDQYNRLADTFQEQGVQVYRYDQKPENMGRPFVRDAIVVIQDTLIICAMKHRSAPDISDLLSEIKTPVLRADKGILEGGDILLDKDMLYVGMGERTESDGLTWLNLHAGSQFDIHPLRLKPEFLHLDVVFNIVNHRTALIYPPAFEETSFQFLKQNYRLFEVTAEEQFSLGVNVVSLTPESVISEKRSERINTFLRNEGLNVIPVDYSEVIKLGGSFRCSTCPLNRDKV